MSSGILEMENWREIFFRDNKLIPMMFSIKSSNFFLLNFAHIRHTYFTNIIVYYDPHIFHIHFHSSVVCCIIEQLLKISKTKKMKKIFFSFDIAVSVRQSKKHKNRYFKMSMKTKAKIKYEKIRL